MNKIDPQSWKADMPDFREKTKAFYNGEMSKVTIKVIPVVMEVMHRKAEKQVCSVFV